jgi:MoaA/NifB/PqqE/SkfB family radical SAM enzyme
MVGGLDMSVSRWRLFKARAASRGWANTWRALELQVAILKHSSPRKIANALLVKAQKWLRRDRVVGMPYRYNIDPTNVCNLRCPVCPTGMGTLQRNRGRMELEDYEKIVDQIAPYAYLLELYNWGEPFLHPRIFDMIRYASERNIFVRLSSNLNHFDRAMAEQTVASGLGALIVSVDGATEATYQKYRRRGQLSKAVENVECLVEAKRQAESRLPYVTLRMLINRYNEHEIEAVRQMAADLGVDIFTTGTLFVNTKDKAQIEEWLPRSEQLSYYDYSADELQNVWHCADLWEAMIINWDGGVSPCCWIQSAENDFDNALARPLTDIWNGVAYVSSRRIFSFDGAKRGDVKTICSVCRGHPEYLNY